MRVFFGQQFNIFFLIRNSYKTFLDAFYYFCTMKMKLSKSVSKLNASIKLPASKSISNRLIIIHALSGTQDKLGNLSDSDDTYAMLKALSSTEQTRNIGHAGTSMRFLSAYYSCMESHVIMTGSERMQQRPIAPLVDALRKLGADITYLKTEGCPPLEIKGKELSGEEITIDGSISSQFLSALLMIAPSLKNGLIINLVGKIVSSSYIKMTLELMKENGASFTWEGNKIRVFPGAYIADKFLVESDWSAASYWYAMAMVGEYLKMEISFLKKNSLQGDSALIDIFQTLGLNTEFRDETVVLTKDIEKHPKEFVYDFTNCPDIVQSMAVALCMAEISFHFTGTQTLRVKETDRITALQTELKKLGYILESDEAGSFLSWNKAKCPPEQNPVIETYHDHRMAMAFAPVALVNGSVIISDPMVVTKSYPKFWKDLETAGFSIE